MELVVFSITEAAKRLGIPYETARVLVKEHDIPTSGSPYHPRVRLLDQAGLEQLDRLSVKFQSPAKL